MIKDLSNQHYNETAYQNGNPAILALQAKTGAINNQSAQNIDKDNYLGKGPALFSVNNDKLTLDIRSITPEDSQKYIPKSDGARNLYPILETPDNQDSNLELSESNSKPISDKRTQNPRSFDGNAVTNNRSTTRCNAENADDYAKDIVHYFVIDQNNDNNTDIIDQPPESPELPVTESGTKPVTESGTKPVTESGTKPVTESGTKPVTESGTKPVTESGTKPVTESGTKPVTESGTKPVTESGTKPVTESGTKPVIEESVIEESVIEKPVIKPIPYGTKLYMAPIGKTEGQEAAIFSEMLKPYEDLDAKQKQAAVLTMIHARMGNFARYKRNTGYELDKNLYPRSILNMEEVIESDFQDLDSNGYATAIRFYASIAKAQGMLPETAKFYTLYIPQSAHAMFCYGAPTDNGFEYYIIDPISINASEYDLYARNFSRFDGIITLAQYRKRFGHWVHEVEVDYEPQLSKEFIPYEVVPFPRKNNELIEQLIRFDVSVEEDLLNSDTTIQDSISAEDILKKQYYYMQTNGKISLPDNYNEADYQSYAEAVQYKDLIGSRFHRYTPPFNRLKVENFDLTKEHARYLIGSWSNAFNRRLTADDLNLSTDVICQLTGTYSPVLERDFTPEDLGSGCEDHYSNLTQFFFNAFSSNQTSSSQNVEERSDLIETDLNVNDTTSEEKLLDVNVENNISLHDDVPSGMRRWHSSWNLANQTSSNQNVEERSDLIETDLNVSDTTTEEIFLDFNVENNLLNNLSFFSHLPNLNAILYTASPAVLGCAINCLLGNIKHNANLKKEKFLKSYLEITDESKKRKDNGKTSPQDLHSLKKLLSLHNEDFLSIDYQQASSNLAYNTQMIAQILLFDKMPLDFNKLQLLVKNLLALYDSSNIEDSILPKNKLLKLFAKLEDQSSFDLTKKDNLESANKVLKFYGMKIKFNTDKILGSTMLRSNVKAFNHLLKIDTSVFYSFLSKINKLIPHSELEKIVNNNIENFIELENELENYYADKLAFHKRERLIHMVKSILTCIPSIPANDLVSILIRVQTIAYIDDKLIAMQERVDNTKQFIATSSLTEDEKSFFESKVSSLNNTKISHLNIKRNRAIHLRRVNVAYTGISVATLAVPAVLYPAKAATRFVANSSIRIHYIKKRYQEDKLNRKHDNHVTTKDMYLLLKDSYLKAIQINNLEKADIMANLSENLFGISSKGFKLLIKTQAVETNRVKLNLYQPIDDDANDNETIV